MSLFRNAGKKFEEAKRAFVGESTAASPCPSCEDPVAEDYEYRPHCGEEMEGAFE